MLIAYLDEFGHQGPFISPSHKKYNTHPVFGYGGYILPSQNVREFGGYFEHIKEDLLSWEINQANAHPRRWEKKGAQLLTSKNISNYGSEIQPAVRRLYNKLDSLGGRIFFFGQEKPIGPVSATKETSQEREKHCLIQTAQRLGRYAKETGEDLLIIMDATDTDNRERAVSVLGKTIYSRGRDTETIIEVPLQADSHLYGTIQFADWTCALLMRLSHYHFCQESDAQWSIDFAQHVLHNNHFTPNSLIWSKDIKNETKLYPQNLKRAKPFWKHVTEIKKKELTRRDRNKAMQQSIEAAMSPEGKSRLAAIRKGLC